MQPLDWITAAELSRALKDRVCPRCHRARTVCEDFRSGLIRSDGLFVRVHRPLYTFRCLAPGCGYREFVIDITASVCDPL